MVERFTNDPLNYLGVRASTPPNTFIVPRVPVGTDTIGPDGPFILGDLWVDTAGLTYHVLLAVAAGVADWRQITTA
ncbi:hypothetical protein LCGC14_1035600 [marine sediment metagenome]|uniref:Uncharacterized protein n=1 Tax=marine sediment metagenome TaxID=412755 RepID=A0A0F9MTC1_9ZZZZ